MISIISAKCPNFMGSGVERFEKIAKPQETGQSTAVRHGIGFGNPSFWAIRQPYLFSCSSRHVKLNTLGFRGRRFNHNSWRFHNNRFRTDLDLFAWQIVVDNNETSSFGRLGMDVVKCCWCMRGKDPMSRAKRQLQDLGPEAG